DVASAFLQTQHTPNHNAIGNTQSFTTQLLGRRRKLGTGLLRFIEVAREQADDGSQRLLLVNSAGDDSQLGATTRSKREDTEDRLRVGLGIAIETLKGEIAFEPAGHAYEVGGGACVKTETAGDLKTVFSHFQSAPAFVGGAASRAPAR